MSFTHGLKNFIVGSWHGFNKFFEILQPVGDLFVRYWVAKSFIASGLTKTVSWQSTLILFQYEYKVPFFTPAAAAIISICVEIGVSILLILGLGGRIPALILFIFNIMAVVSYPFLLTPQGYVGLKDHICWGILLLILLLHGSGKLSLDYIIAWWYKRRYGKQ